MFMRRSRVVARLRLLLAALFLFSSLVSSPGASAQTTNFQLTWVYFYCASFSFDFEWTSSGPISSITFDFYDDAAGAVTESHLETVDLSSPYIHDLTGSFSPDLVIVTAEMETVPAEVFQYTVVMPGPDFCGVDAVGGSISGGYVLPPPPPPPDVTISISNATCTGFDWSVNASEDVIAYVSVMDSTNQNMIPVVPRVGANLAGSESYAVENESQTNFTIYVTVVDTAVEAQLDSDSLELDCPLPGGSETPDATSTETPDATATETPDATSTETPNATSTEPPDMTETPDPLATVTPEPGPSDTPTEAPTITPPVAVVTEPAPILIIGILIPFVGTIEGAPYSIYAPEAAQISGGRYRSGTVGSNNIIREEGLLEGQYRILIEPAGIDPIDFIFSVGASPVTELLAVVEDDGTVTVTQRQAGQPPLEELTTGVPVVVETQPVPTDASVPTETGGSVTGLPSTGSGDSAIIPRFLAVTLATVLAGLLSMVVARGSSQFRK